jgi:hypothetical protein
MSVGHQPTIAVPILCWPVKNVISYLYLGTYATDGFSIWQPAQAGGLKD